MNVMGLRSISASSKLSLGWKLRSSTLPVIKLRMRVCTTALRCCMRKKCDSSTSYGEPSIIKRIPLLRSVYARVIASDYTFFGKICKKKGHIAIVRDAARVGCVVSHRFGDTGRLDLNHRLGLQFWSGTI